MAWRWVSPAELMETIVDFKRPLYQTVLDEFAAYLGKR
jgi:hypothetical protein